MQDIGDALVGAQDVRHKPFPIASALDSSGLDFVFRRF
jgi:hypothetical protein